MGRMSKRWHSWLIEHVRSIETFATVVSSRSEKVNRINLIYCIVKEFWIRIRTPKMLWPVLQFEFELEELENLVISVARKRRSKNLKKGKFWHKWLLTRIQEHKSNVFLVNWFQEGISGYCKLDLSKKFRPMTFLCDEALNTEKLRRYIQDENSRQSKAVKEAKLKNFAAKEKKLLNEKAKVSPCPMEEHDALIDIRTQVDEAHTNMLRLKSTNQKGMS
ncbi:hypothetical protein DEO72_LG3g2556 [Vigna unguiculata]|uniref:Uncharacterized protein n=1 Tax=Vigna unguiculata TaxID=3917 RepID=A0A4D6LI29_VIGUN|nr:hypothetical protein DEO72_LG3g2556 [Vigna unguiculata]